MTLVMMFQNPFSLSHAEAASESAAYLLQSTVDLARQAGLNAEQTDQFVSARQRAIDDFNKALRSALNAGQADRKTLALRVARLLGVSG
jgi:hypothetical protein